MLKCAISLSILDSLKLLFRGKRKAVFCTKVFLSLIDVAIFVKKIFNAEIVLNY